MLHDPVSSSCSRTLVPPVKGLDSVDEGSLLYAVSHGVVRMRLTLIIGRMAVMDGQGETRVWHSHAGCSFCGSQFEIAREEASLTDHAES